MKVGPPKQVDITTKATAGAITTVIFEKPVYSIVVRNESSSYALYASFDGGETWITIPTDTDFSVEPFADKGKPVVLLKSDGTSQSVEIVYRLKEGE